MASEAHSHLPQNLHKPPHSSQTTQPNFVEPSQIPLSGSTVQRARLDPQSLIPQQVLQLQRAIGNQAVARLLARSRIGDASGGPERAAAQRSSDRQARSPSAGAADTRVDETGTNLPPRIKTGIETLSGQSMQGVTVHYKSPKPAQIQALAYAKGNDIYVASGQERHLAHEAWHVAQQRQGRVKPTIQAKGLPVNDDNALEREADVMGAKSLFAATSAPNSGAHAQRHGTASELSAHSIESSLMPARKHGTNSANVIQRKMGSISLKDDGKEVKALYAGDGDLTLSKGKKLGSLTYEIGPASYKDSRDTSSETLEVMNVDSEMKTLSGIGAALIYGAALKAESIKSPHMYVINSIVNDFYKKVGFDESTFIDLNMFGDTTKIKSTSHAKALEKGWSGLSYG